MLRCARAGSAGARGDAAGGGRGAGARARARVQGPQRPDLQGPGHHRMVRPEIKHRKPQSQYILRRKCGFLYLIPGCTASSA
eukprot:1266732-Rhodomonas_salina.1